MIEQHDEGQHDEGGSASAEHAAQTEAAAQVQATSDGQEESDGQQEPEEAPADPRVADAVRRLGSLPELPLADQVEVYESVHRSLQEALAEAAQPGEDDPRSAPS